MQFLNHVLSFLQSESFAMGILVLFGISESLAQIPSVKANSVFQLLVQGLNFIKNKVIKPKL